MIDHVGLVGVCALRWWSFDRGRRYVCGYTDPPGVLCQVEMVLSYRWV
jgi:hypothetical protein